MSIEDLRLLANKYNVVYTEDELVAVYNFVKDDYQELLNQNIESFQKIKDKINPKLYSQLLNTYIDLKQKFL